MAIGSRTYLDGLGRVAHIQRGDSSATRSVVDISYDTCGCNPIGKMVQRSMP